MNMAEQESQDKTYKEAHKRAWRRQVRETVETRGLVQLIKKSEEKKTRKVKRSMQAINPIDTPESLDKKIGWIIEEEREDQEE